MADRAGVVARDGGGGPQLACRSVPVRRSALVVAAVVLLGGALVVSGPRRATAQELPEGVTREVVRQGERLFGGDGFCYTCHGRDGGGIPNLAADLTDDAWTHLDGSLVGLEAVIRDGVPAEESSTGIPMPPNGGADLSPEQVRALAAYVWTLSRDGPGGEP